MYSYSNYAAPFGGPHGHFMNRDSFGPFASTAGRGGFGAGRGRGGFGAGRGGFGGQCGRFPHSGHFHPGAGLDTSSSAENAFAGQTEIWLAGDGADQDCAAYVDDEYDQSKSEGNNDEKPTPGVGKSHGGCHGRPGFGFHGPHRSSGGPGFAGPSCGPHRHGMRGGFRGPIGRRGGPDGPFGSGGNSKAAFFFWPGVPDFKGAEGFEDFGRGPHCGMRGGGHFGRRGRGGRGRAGFRGLAGLGRHGFDFNPRDPSPFVFIDTVESIDFVPPVDIVKDADGFYKIFVALAGLSLSSPSELAFTNDILNVQVTGPSTLIIEGIISSIQDAAGTNKQTVLQAELGTGRFSRTICFSPGNSSLTIEEDSLKSEWKGDGILEITIKLKSSEKKSVPVELA